jgi:hypothetical protein
MFLLGLAIAGLSLFLWSQTGFGELNRAIPSPGGLQYNSFDSWRTIGNYVLFPEHP